MMPYDVIYFDRICDTPFWNQSLSWFTNRPALTPCFVDTALTWTPAIFLWLTFPYTFYDYIVARRPPIRWNALNVIRSIVALILAIIGIVHAILVIVQYSQHSDGSNISRAEVISVMVTAITYCLLTIFLYLQRTHGFVNGGAIWFYLLLQVLVIAISLPTEWHFPEHRSHAERAFRYIELIFTIALLFICSFADRIPNLEELMSSPNLYGKDFDESVKRKLTENLRSEDFEQKICPKELASFPSKLTFWWFTKMALLGFKRPLMLSDMWSIRRTDRCTQLFHSFNQWWGHKSFTKQTPVDNVADAEPPPKPNLFSMIGKQFWYFFLIPSLARLVTDNLQLANPIVMKYLINFTTDKTAPQWHGYFYTLIFVVINVLVSFTSSYHQHRMSALGIRIRSSIIGSLYRKSLVLAPHSKMQYTTGEIVNLMAVDSQRFADMLPWFCFLWTAPVQIGISLWLLWNELGVSVLGGLALMITFIPINGYIAGAVKRIQAKQMGLKDKRLKAINEMLNGIKVLKLYAWEKSFIENIQKIRIKEINYIRRAGYISTIFNLISACSPFMVSSLTFAIYIFIDESNQLDAQKAFVSITLFNLLRIPLAMIPNMMSYLILTIISVKRINKFLNSDETIPYVQRHIEKTTAIRLTNASFSWQQIDGKGKSNENVPTNDLSSKHPQANYYNATLSNLNLNIEKGELVAIVGNVGSGKSSLLYSLLSEMQKISGSVNISGDLQLAFIAQQAWIQNATVRDNICFGTAYDAARYMRVIDACALKSDLTMLTAGDQTEIGEKGINLSGGQKQRVSIARACYSHSDLFLFDDPLSAVDSHVGKHIFDQVLDSRTGILAGTTRVLVTNALYMLPNVDRIVLLKQGTIEAIGSYEQLLANSSTFSELITNYTNSNLDDETKIEDIPINIAQNQTTFTENEDEINSPEVLQNDCNTEIVVHHRRTSSSVQTKERAQSSVSTQSNGVVVLNQNKTEITADDNGANKTLENKSQLVAAEHMESGQVTWSVYSKFFRALSIFWTVIILFNYLMMVVANTGSNFWLSAWTSSSDGTTRSHFYLGIYFAIGISQAIFVACGWLSIVRGSLLASRKLHWRLLNSMVHAPMHFFDTTPLGRIVNRFSKDIDILDSNIQLVLRVILNTSLTVLATLFTVSFNTPIFIAVVIPFLAFYIFVQRFYISTSRQIKRLESVTRSPIFTHFSETINGSSTIKAYNAAERFIHESDRRVDENTRCMYPNAVSNCFLQVRLEFMANFLIFFAAMFIVLSKNNLTGSETGLSLSYALNVTLSLNVCVRMFSEIENNVISVERISEYTEVTPEADWHTEADTCLGSDWPEKGVISFNAYGTRYRPGLDLVLRKIDIDTKCGEKIGIVGRTGAGKSSLTLALFRIIEAANGAIRMDGVDIATLGLQTLRSRITIIPQDPVLFCGTIRTNLDPLGTYSDEQLWNVLELAHLKRFVSTLDEGLQYTIAEGGENLSVGQRQLICLARALLRRTNVLVLDEATAAVDLETDSLIQTTIRTQFAHCTVLTIAHRLHTILDSDRVLVLDAGNVAEFDSPKTLLADHRSIFYSLARDAGIV